MLGSSTIGLVLLDRKDRYLVNGKIPVRPDFDKQFLLNMVSNKACLASINTINDLPDSIINSCLEITENGHLNWTVNLGIKTFKEFPPDIFFISRTPAYEPVQVKSKNDKYFDIEWLKSNYDIGISNHDLEIWIKK